MIRIMVLMMTKTTKYSKPTNYSFLLNNFLILNFLSTTTYLYLLTHTYLPPESVIYYEDREADEDFLVTHRSPRLEDEKSSTS